MAIGDNCPRFFGIGSLNSKISLIFQRQTESGYRLIIDDKNFIHVQILCIIIFMRAMSASQPPPAYGDWTGKFARHDLKQFFALS